MTIEDIINNFPEYKNTVYSCENTAKIVSKKYPKDLQNCTVIEVMNHHYVVLIEYLPSCGLFKVKVISHSSCCNNILLYEENFNDFYSKRLFGGGKSYITKDCFYIPYYEIIIDPDYEYGKYIE